METFERLRLKNTKLNPEITQKYQNEQKFKDFLNWCREQGVLYNDLEVPAAFGNGLPGIAASNDIPAKKVIAAIPQKLIINKYKIAENEKLGQIMQENPEIFDDELYPSNEFNSFTMFLIYEKLKGVNSFFYHYLNTMQDSSTLLEWTEKNMEHTDDDYLISECKSVLQDISIQIVKLHQCLLQHQDIFPKDKVDIKMIFWAYQSVMTRIFGWSVPTGYMVPFADLFNHNDSKNLNHFLINLKNERENNQTQNYILRKKKVNFETIFQDEKLKPTGNLQYKNKMIEHILKNKNFLEDENIKNQINEQYLQEQGFKSQRKILYKINEKKYLEKHATTEKYKQAWEMLYFTSSDMEDNDTDEDLAYERKNALKNMHTREIAQLEIKKRKEKNQLIKTSPLQSIFRKKIFKEDMREHDDLKDEDLIDSEDSDLPSESSQTSSGEESDDKEWQWYKENDENNYFILNTQHPYKKGEQMHVCYGSRTNKFLLLWYGFAMFNNKYDSVSLRFNMGTQENRLGEELINSLVFNKFVEKQDAIMGFVFEKNHKINLQDITKDFKIKASQVNIDLLNYLRIFLMIHYKGPDYPYICATIPVSLIYEEFIVKFGLHILLHLRKQYRSSISQDIYTLENQKIDPKIEFCIVYRANQKHILDQQIKIFKNLQIFLKELKNSTSIKETCNKLLKSSFDIEEIHQLKPYLEIFYYSIRHGFYLSTHKITKEDIMSAKKEEIQGKTGSRSSLQGHRRPEKHCNI